MKKMQVRIAAALGSAALVATGAVVTQTATAAPEPAAKSAAPSVKAAAAAAKLSHSEAASRLSAAGIDISSSGGCSDRGNPTCTSLEQVNEASIDGAVTLKQASGCPMTVTGGTETGHAGGEQSHGTGFKLDFALNSCLDGYVKNTFTYIGERGDGAPLYESSAGNVYALESNHWDVLFQA